jgi:hypothetical protein
MKHEEVEGVSGMSLIPVMLADRIGTVSVPS